MVCVRGSLRVILEADVTQWGARGSLKFNVDFEVMCDAVECEKQFKRI